MDKMCFELTFKDGKLKKIETLHSDSNYCKTYEPLELYCDFLNRYDYTVPMASNESYLINKDNPFYYEKEDKIRTLTALETEFDILDLLNLFSYPKKSEYLQYIESFTNILADNFVYSCEKNTLIPIHGHTLKSVNIDPLGKDYLSEPYLINPTYYATSYYFEQKTEELVLYVRDTILAGRQNEISEYLLGFLSSDEFAKEVMHQFFSKYMPYYTVDTTFSPQNSLCTELRKLFPKCVSSRGDDLLSPLPSDLFNEVQLRNIDSKIISSSLFKYNLNRYKNYLFSLPDLVTPEQWQAYVDEWEQRNKEISKYHLWLRDIFYSPAQNGIYLEHFFFDEYLYATYYDPIKNEKYDKKYPALDVDSFSFSNRIDLLLQDSIAKTLTLFSNADTPNPRIYIAQQLSGISIIDYFIGLNVYDDIVHSGLLNEMNFSYKTNSLLEVFAFISTMYKPEDLKRCMSCNKIFEVEQTAHQKKYCSPDCLNGSGILQINERRQKQKDALKERSTTFINLINEYNSIKKETRKKGIPQRDILDKQITKIYKHFFQSLVICYLLEESDSIAFSWEEDRHETIVQKLAYLQAINKIKIPFPTSENDKKFLLSYKHETYTKGIVQEYTIYYEDIYKHLPHMEKQLKDICGNANMQYDNMWESFSSFLSTENSAESKTCHYFVKILQQILSKSDFQYALTTDKKVTSTKSNKKILS